jgi:hypothetical protein
LLSDLGKAKDAAVAMSRYLQLEDRESADESREDARLIIAAAKK